MSKAVAQFMKKRIFVIPSIILFISICAGSYALFLRNITPSRYNKIMSYYVARKITKDTKGFEKNVIALRDYVHRNVHPIGESVPNYETSMEHLLYGIGWCDQQSRIFMWLARSIGITTRLLFLKTKSGSSPHSIAEALAPNGRWVIVDPLFSISFRTKDGRLAGQDDIREDISVIVDNDKIREYAKSNSRWADPDFLAIYYNQPQYVTTKKGVNFDFLRLIPLGCLKPIINIIQKRYFRKIKSHFDDVYEFDMLNARGYHLLGYYKKSEALYNKIINKSSNTQLIQKVEFYKVLLLEEQGKYQSATKYIDKIINKYQTNPYIDYLKDIRKEIAEESKSAAEFVRHSLKQSRCYILACVRTF